MTDREDQAEQDEGEFEFATMDFETMLQWSGAGVPELVKDDDAADGEASVAEAVVVEEAEDATGDFEKAAAGSGDATGDFEKAAAASRDATGDFEKSAPASRDATGDFESGAPSVNDTGDFSRDDDDAASAPSDSSTARFGTGDVKGIQKHDPSPVTPAQAYLKDIIGSTVGGCRLDEELGHGAMGTVFRATHLSLDKPVAVKILNPSLFFERKHVDSFFREARAAASLEHQNILTVHNVGSERGLLFIIMQLVEGESLADRVAREVKLSPAEVARIGIEASEGLGIAHENRIIHRDIKPANLMLTFAGEVKIADFGLAKRTGKNRRLTASGDILGTPAYMSPEQIDGREVDHRTDLYSLGVTLYYASTGHKPFEAAMLTEVLQMHLHEAPEPPAARDPDVPHSLSKTIFKLLAKDPDHRQPDAAALIADLELVLAETGPPPASPPPPAAEPEAEKGKTPLGRFRRKINDVFRPFRWTSDE